MRSSGVVLALLVLAVLLAPQLSAQSFYGGIVGAVTDATGASVPGASVTLTNTATNERRTAESDAAGNYRFVNLVPGVYKVDVEKTGFKHLTRDQIAVQVESTVRIDAAMQVGEITQTMEVTAQTPLLQTQTTSMSQVVEGRTVQEMPLNGRNVLNLVALSPGVVPQGQAMGTTTGTNIFAWGNYQIGGGMANQAASFLDGAPLNVNYANLTALVPMQDAISEFRVQTSNLSPEFGRFSGGVINLSTKSGGNEFHGSAYEYFRNKKLNANNFFNNRAGTARPAFNQNQFGANLGGPVVKDKLFFFFAYEGFRLRQGSTYINTVPTLEMRRGDFSNTRNAAGALIPIYDPLTTCGTGTNPACAAGQTVTRTPFPGNIIPANRINPTSAAFLSKLLPVPNGAGDRYTAASNYVAVPTIGGNNDQYNFRADWSTSDKQRIFGRYTRWNATTLAKDPYKNLTYAANEGPEYFNTHQIVLADTYTFTPTLIGDLRLSWLRFPYGRVPESLDFDLSTMGLPASMNSQIPFRTLPSINVQGMNNTGQVYIFCRNDTMSLVPSLTKIAGKHTVKFGGEVRRLTFNFTQVNNPSGIFNFNNLFTSANPQAPSVGGVTTGFGMASFLLGYGSDGSLTVPNLTAGGMIYQGYYISDTFQVTPRFTLNLGIRWEIPGPWTERFDRLTVFLPTAANPQAPSYNGTVALVNSDLRKSRYQTDKRYNYFVPRLGAAYRLGEKMVLRGGYGMFYIPSDVTWQMAPYFSPVSSIQTTWSSTLDGSITPSAPLNNPFPSGLLQPPGHSSNYGNFILGQTLGSGVVIPDESLGYVQQWNLNIQRQMAEGLLLEVGYAGARGVHLSGGPQQMDQLPDQYLSLGSSLQQQVANPFYGKVISGPLAAATVARGQLLRPYPQFNGISNSSAYNRNSSYNSLQLKVEKRLRQGGVILASYAWSKNIGDSESTTTWLEGSGGGGGTAGIQNVNNLKLEKSLSSFDVSHRLVLSYVLDLPVGKGKHFLGGVSGVADKLLSGWGINGVSTFQSGFPMKFTTSSNLTNSFGGNSRPNVVGGCDKFISGTAQSRLNKWFNTACFTAPPAFTFGNESRTDPNLRGIGINNFDVSLFKTTKITERVGLQFRTEFFNIANRVQFGFPGQALGVAQFGVVSAQANQPRLVQFALRLTY